MMMAFMIEHLSNVTALEPTNMKNFYISGDPTNRLPGPEVR
jgi:hypothetical protein